MCCHDATQADVGLLFSLSDEAHLARLFEDWKCYVQLLPKLLGRQNRIAQGVDNFIPVRLQYAFDTANELQNIIKLIYLTPDFPSRVFFTGTLFPDVTHDMNNTMNMANVVGNEETNPIKKLLFTFLSTRSEVFCQLAELQREGWNNPQVDEHFEKQRRVADAASSPSSYRARKGFYDLMQRIGDEMQEATGVLSLPKPEAGVLDICMAPGGYSASALKYSPHAHVSGITLPNTVGGHQLLIPYGRNDPRVEIQFADVTMLAAEYGITELPMDHQDISQLTRKRPWPTRLFDLVFCDGQVLRTHQPHRASYREQSEAARLTCSQLILAMQRIKPGGTFIMLLHKVQEWRTMKLLGVFDKISRLRLFKPMQGHRTRGSFYLIAEDVQPRQPEAIGAVNEWKATWKNATFPAYTDKEISDPAEVPEEHVRPEEVSEFLASFGERLIELGEPIWRIQKDALEGWLKRKKTESAREKRQEAKAAGPRGLDTFAKRIR